MRLPQIRRLLLEDFVAQKAWISPLFTNLNLFMEGVVTGFNKGLTIKENMAADVRTITMTSVPTATVPMLQQWSLKSQPISVHVGNVYRQDGVALVLTNAVQVQWVFVNDVLQITNIVGVTPSLTIPIEVTLVIFTG